MEILNAQFTAIGSITALVDGVEVSIPADAGNRHYAEMLEQGIQIAAYVAPTPTYAEQRAAAYPSIADQLDQIYHDGLDAWKATILAVKQEFPKP